MHISAFSAIYAIPTSLPSLHTSLLRDPHPMFPSATVPLVKVTIASMQRISISRHVFFDDTTFPFSLQGSTPSSSLDFLLADDAALVLRTAAVAPSSVVAPSLGDVEQPRPPRALLEDPANDPVVLYCGPLIQGVSAHAWTGRIHGLPSVAAAAPSTAGPSAAFGPALERQFQFVCSR